MPIPTSKKRRFKIYAALSGVAVLALFYLVLVGIFEANILNGTMPSWLMPCAAAFSRPAYWAINVDLLVVRVPARIFEDLGYSLADGPETTR